MRATAGAMPITDHLVSGSNAAETWQGSGDGLSCDRQ
jgi:hypothetical protein